MAKASEGDTVPTKVLVVDDQMLYREGLASLMAHWPEFEVVGDASDGRKAVELCHTLKPDLVLMDVQMPEMDGIEAARLIHGEDAHILIVMLTVSTDEKTLFEAFCAGVVGYVSKDAPSSQLRSHLQAAVRGDMVLSGLMTEKIIKRFLNSSSSLDNVREQQAFHPDLSERDIELLRLVAEGLSNDEIAAQMYISFGTVKKNLQVLMQKLQLPNRVMLAGYAIRKGLVD